MALSKTVPQTPYGIWHGNLASYKYLRVWGSAAYVRRLVGDKLDSRSSLCRFVRYPKKTAGYYYYDPFEQKIFVSMNAVFLEKYFPADSRRDEVLLEESSEEPQHNDATSFEPSVSTDGVPVLRRSTRESRPPESLELTGRLQPSRLGSWRKGYTQQLRDDFEETYSPVAMAKSIQKLLVIATWYDYEIWQMDVKTAFLNSFVEEEIFMDQPKGFNSVRKEQKVCRLQSLLIGKHIKMLGDIKAWLSTQFSMMDMGEVSYILGIKIYRDRSRRILGLTQSSYIEKVLKRFKMKNSKRGFLPIKYGIKLSKKQSPKTDEELKRMSDIPYASAVGSIQYAFQCTRPDVAYALSVTSRYQACAEEAHWRAVKTILKYLKRTKDMFLIYGGEQLILEGYNDASFQLDDDNATSQSSFVFKLNGGVVAWKSSKQATTADSTTKA
ncbi:UNVERIFIED_CONTAM: Retrovirus-related Pol polyprotein from transposon TNT 1-94 [Sesamum latifolium]|uniref:Retrovirus-related Pol polyprotein from transposon TNT 1-94 n=1 Tax=Sesamum latifolium TaxID=2727402 RepID=A0AAW2X5S4_9LAMI